MKDIQIRLMEYRDCEAVHRLFLECFSDPWTLSNITDMFSGESLLPGYNCYLAFCEGNCVGFAGYLAVYPEADIINVAVEPSFRRRGIAERLLGRLLGDKPGIERIFLEVRASNEAAINLYEKFVFKKLGRRKNYYTNPCEDALIMVYQKDFAQIP